MGNKIKRAMKATANEVPVDDGFFPEVVEEEHKTAMIAGRTVRVCTDEEIINRKLKPYATKKYSVEYIRERELEILEIIVKHKLMRFKHVFGQYQRMSEGQAFRLGLDSLPSIIDLLERHRAEGVNYLLKRWITSENSTLQIAAMRMICSKEEHRLLNQHYQELTGKAEDTERLMGFEITVNNEAYQLPKPEDKAIEGEVVGRIKRVEDNGDKNE